MSTAPGQMLQGRYHIISLLGQGGMGAVYKAQDTRLGSDVAVKEMLPQPGINPHELAQLRQQFRNEAAVLAQLDHSSLVDVLDFFEEGGNSYLVMRFIRGESLADHLARHGPLPEPRMLNWAGQLLDALDHCHSRSVIHRDIKPQNVIITPESKAILVDFGLVKLWDPNDPHTKTAMRGMGTPEYAPPEQYSTHQGYTDPRSDLYSLGATLYHAATGQAPLAATDRIAAPDQFAKPRALNQRVSPRTEATILRAMELSRDRRFRNAHEMKIAVTMAAQATARSPVYAQPRRTPPAYAQPRQAFPPAHAQPRRAFGYPQHQPARPQMAALPRSSSLGQAGLSAGLIGAAVAFFLALAGILPSLVSAPTVECVCMLLPLLAYIGAGVTGGLFLAPPRSAGAGAGAGAISGLITGVGTTIGWTIDVAFQMFVLGAEDASSGLDPQTLEMLTELGISPAVFDTLTGVAGVFLAGGMCCLCSLAIGAGIGALCGLITAAAKPR